MAQLRNKMFTGIITELGIIQSISNTHSGAKLTISCPSTAKDASIGDSIAVNGMCLTVTTNDKDRLEFDISRQSLNVTTAGYWKVGDKVNLEPALRIGDKIGGHLVSGHVEDIGKILSKMPYGNAQKITIQSPRSILNYAIPKGSIAIDGISLTIVDVDKETFSVVIIPHTLKMTTLGFKGVGEMVNLEPDMLAKYVFHFINKITDNTHKDTVFLEVLKKSGYL
ncbi:MAG: riboflavin synthase [Thermodesulfovibrionales bacterium]|nr:riboflavin synthase [Thermodesulfovibrionales bacterium]